MSAAKPEDLLKEYENRINREQHPVLIRKLIAGWIHDYFPPDHFALGELIDEIRDIVEYMTERESVNSNQHLARGRE